MDTKKNYTPQQAREIGFDRSLYAPATEGSFTGKLVMKIYGDLCLRCYFETDSGERLKLTAWQNRKTGMYGPRGCEADLKSANLGTIWNNRVGLSRNGKLSWVFAELSGVTQ